MSRQSMPWLFLNKPRQRGSLSPRDSDILQTSRLTKKEFRLLPEIFTECAVTCGDAAGTTDMLSFMGPLSGARLQRGLGVSLSTRSFGGYLNAAVR
jgi:hypothetical protein